MLSPEAAINGPEAAINGDHLFGREGETEAIKTPTILNRKLVLPLNYQMVLPESSWNKATGSSLCGLHLPLGARVPGCSTLAVCDSPLLMFYYRLHLYVECFVSLQDNIQGYCTQFKSWMCSDGGTLPCWTARTSACTKRQENCWILLVSSWWW